MSTSTPLYDQLLSLLSQHTRYRDWGHLKALAWMVNALICSGKINLSEWESYVVSRATKAQSIERRWQRFVHNRRIKVRSLYVPLVMAAIHDWTHQRVYLALEIKRLTILLPVQFLKKPLVSETFFLKLA